MTGSSWRATRLLPLCLWLVAVPWLLLAPVDAAPALLPEWLVRVFPSAVVGVLEAMGDKLVHAVLFGIGAALLHRLSLSLSVAVLAAAAYGGLMEWIQRSFPPRSAEWGDVIANLVGALLYAFAVLGYRRWRGIR